MEHTTFETAVTAMAGKAPFAIGDVVLHPSGRRVKIVSGQYMGDYNRVSNFWRYREVLSDGTLGKEENGYGWQPPPKAPRFRTGFDVMKCKLILQESINGEWGNQKSFDTERELNAELSRISNPGDVTWVLR